jgi:uncharacterized protein
MELTAAEGRVLGCLIEQEAAAPEAVPLTLNALRLACNQPTGRVPVVAYDDRTVEDTLLALKSRGLARFVPPTDDVRTTRYRHRADERWRMGPGDLAVLAVLLLRGVQSVDEVRAQARRLCPFADASQVDAVLDALAARTPRPFAARVASGAGGAPRWAQVLTGPAPNGAAGGDAARDGAGTGVARAGWSAGGRVVAEVAAPSYADLVARVAELERRLAGSVERAVPADRGAAALPPPPPPPPVDVRTRPAGQLGMGGDGGRHGPEPAALVSELADLVDRIGDIERRLARIEAELGALR